MENDQSNATAIKERIAGWLAATRDVNPAVGLERAEADSRVRDLLRAILEKRISPDAIVLDEEIKQVLSVLVRQLAESVAAPEERLHDADAVYQFIRGLSWPDTGFGEQRDLLAECAAIGWGAVELTLAQLARRRAGEEVSSLTGFGRCFDDATVLLGLCRALRGKRDIDPSAVLEEARSVYDSLITPGALASSRLVLDERDFFLGELAYLIGSSCRLLGRRDEAEAWLLKAQERYAVTLSSAPFLADLSYARLAIRYDQGRLSEVLGALPSLTAEFRRLGMSTEWVKSQIFKAITLKLNGASDEALTLLERLRSSHEVRIERVLQGRILIELGDLYQIHSRFAEALDAFRSALPLLRQSGLRVPLADLKLTFGATLRHLGRNEDALAAYRSAKDVHLALRMKTRAAYIGVLCAEILLALGRPSEAEAEILATLRTIEEQKMVPEGFAAVALLKESVRQRKADPNALRELREHLQAGSL